MQYYTICCAVFLNLCAESARELRGHATTQIKGNIGGGSNFLIDKLYILTTLYVLLKSVFLLGLHKKHKGMGASLLIFFSKARQHLWAGGHSYYITNHLQTKPLAFNF